MKIFHFLVVVVILALASSFAFGYDPSPLQDYCVAINDTELGGNGLLLFFLFII